MKIKQRVAQTISAYLVKSSILWQLLHLYFSDFVTCFMCTAVCRGGFKAESLLGHIIRKA